MIETDHMPTARPLSTVSLRPFSQFNNLSHAFSPTMRKQNRKPMRIRNLKKKSQSLWKLKGVEMVFVMLQWRQTVYVQNFIRCTEQQLVSCTCH